MDYLMVTVMITLLITFLTFWDLKLSFAWLSMDGEKALSTFVLFLFLHCSVINYSPLCSSKPVSPTFIFRKQIKIFLMKSKKISPHQYSNATDTFNFQKGGKNIIKVVHMCLQCLNLNFMKQ